MIQYQFHSYSCRGSNQEVLAFIAMLESLGYKVGHVSEEIHPSKGGYSHYNVIEHYHVEFDTESELVVFRLTYDDTITALRRYSFVNDMKTNVE
jgi:hypothetical protein